jgi:hypothetical protein
MEVEPLKNMPTAIDTSLFYTELFYSWKGLDSTRADSLADWFATASHPITDMWFPNIMSMCTSPFPDNLVVVKLAVPDTTIRSLGFKSLLGGFGPCYLYWRHYIFIRSSAGA